MQLKTIKVYGRLRKFLGSSYFEAAVSSPAEAIRFLMCNFPEVEAHMSKQYYKVKMNNMDVSLDFLSMKGKGDIQIIPIATGSIPAIAAVVGGIGSVATAAVGAATAVAGAAITTVATVGGAVAAGIGAVASGIGTAAGAVAAIPVVGNIATAVAADLAIDGVTSLIAPTPAPFESPSSAAASSFGASEPDGALDPQFANSYSFSGIQNVSVSGVSVPIIYGEVFTGSVVISSGIDTVQVEGTT
jgi:predicted phage tail protein